MGWSSRGSKWSSTKRSGMRSSAPVLGSGNKSPSYEMKDLYQDGVIGYLKSMQTFDPKRGNFQWYAGRMVKFVARRAVEHLRRSVVAECVDPLDALIAKEHERLQRAVDRLPCREKKVMIESLRRAIVVVATGPCTGRARPEFPAVAIRKSFFLSFFLSAKFIKILSAESSTRAGV